MPGRPPLPPKERRELVVNIPVNAAEKKEIQAGAEADGQKFITWARETLLKAARRRKRL